MRNPQMATLHEAVPPKLYGGFRPVPAEGGVEMVGEISDAGKPAFLPGAVALLMPIAGPEPFGLVMIDDMVIAFDRGSVPEIDDDDVTGFVVENEAAAIAAMSRWDGFRARRCGLGSPPALRRGGWLKTTSRCNVASRLDVHGSPLLEAAD